MELEVGSGKRRNFLHRATLILLRRLRQEVSTAVTLNELYLLSIHELSEVVRMPKNRPRLVVRLNRRRRLAG